MNNKVYNRFMRKIVDWHKVIDMNLVQILNKEAVPEVINIIMEDYNFFLNDVANPKSKLAPELYEDEFKKRLENFRFVDMMDTGVKFISPDMKNFDFSDELDVIENILEGIIGIYVEVDREDYVKAIKMQTYRGEYKDVYLIKYSSTVKSWEKALNKKFDKYPFSNSPPIDIFSRADDFIEKGLDEWISIAIDKSEKELK